MGDVKLTTFQTILMFLLMPIVFLGLGVVCLAITLKNAFRRLFQLLTNGRGSCDGAKVTDEIAHPITGLHQRLYKYATLGDTHMFTTTLADVSENSEDVVEALSHTTPQNNTYLHVAAALQNQALAMEILEVYPMLLFRQNEERDSPLHIAAKEGKKKVVEALLAKENEIRSEGVKGELLTDTVENGYPFLHNMQNCHDNTALQEALINGHAPVAQKLIETDPTVRNWFQMVNKEDKSALYLAVEAGFVKLVEIMKEKAKNLDDRMCGGKSPLQAAILTRNIEMLKILSSMKLSIIKAIDEEEKTALHYAASTGYLKGLGFLLSQSTVDAYKKDLSGIFPIHTAASKGYVGIIKAFLEHCPDSAELLTTSGQNILHVASKCGKDNVVSYALKNQTLRKFINQKDDNGDTPLHLAAKFRHPMVASNLTWDKRISLKLVNNQNFTALDIVEGNTNTITSFCGRLTWIALKSGGVQRAQDLHCLKKRVSQTPTPTSSKSLNLDQMVDLQCSKLSDSASLKERVNTLLLVTVLVATVTFAAGFTMPGGYNSSESKSQGMATMLTKIPFQIFIICDSMAMYCSIVVAVTLMWAQLGDLSLVLSALGLALPLLGIALTMMSATFTAGVFVAVSNVHWLAGVIVGMGGLFITIITSLFIPLFFPSQSKNLIVRYITYYPFRLAVLASRNYTTELEE